MRSLCLFLALIALCSACVPLQSSAQPAVTIPPSIAASVATPPPAPQPEADSASWLCEVPRHDLMSVSAGEARQDAIMFGTCADFRIMFFESLAHGCEKAAPDLAQAMRRIAGEFYKPELTSSEQIAYSTQLIEAAAPHISPRCQPDRGLELLEDDYGRTINDLTLTYREPACEPDPDLFVLTTTDQPASQAFGMAYVDSGVHYFALALRPFLSSLGVMMLRKLLFCSIIQNFPGKYWGPRLPTDPTREALPEPFFESLRQP